LINSFLIQTSFILDKIIINEIFNESSFTLEDVLHLKMSNTQITGFYEKFLIEFKVETLKLFKTTKEFCNMMLIDVNSVLDVKLRNELFPSFTLIQIYHFLKKVSFFSKFSLKMMICQKTVIMRMF
jgi:hypothetical protein